MSRCNFIENPQVVVWREKCEELKEEYEELRISYMSVKEYADFLSRRVRDYKQELETFNSLPWWKKMFHKFLD